MAIIARDIIEQARMQHPSFTVEQHPDTMLLNQLSRIERRLVSKVVLVFPALISDEEIVVPAEHDFALGHQMPAFHKIGGATAEYADGSAHAVDLVAWENRHHAVHNLAIYQRQGWVRLAGAAADWRAVTRVVITYTPIPEDFEGFDEESVLPDTAEPTLIAALADYMASRPGPGDDAAPRAAFALEKKETEADFLELVRRSRPAVMFAIRQAW